MGIPVGSQPVRVPQLWWEQVFEPPQWHANRLVSLSKALGLFAFSVVALAVGLP